mgnify:CR=1 FL=1|jgi:hypothetical protein
MTEILRARVPRGPNGEKDPNDWAQSGQVHVIEEAVRQAEAEADGNAKTESKGSIVPSRAALVATEEELAVARLTPKVIVDQLLYADVAQIVAPGATGKTTLILYMALRIALGELLFGQRVITPGETVIVTAEDQRERLLARLREIMARMPLSPEERAKVLASVLIWDVTGLGLKLTEARDGNLQLTSLADDISAAFADHPPAVIVFDPLVSFGVSEQAVNDNEQALVTAARRMVRKLECCVTVIHHTGKANARGGTLDQYSGRGGSALADGSRMTMVLQTWKPGDGDLRPPPTCTPDKESHISVLARAKLSYAPPDLPLIWIKRIGFSFEHHYALEVTLEEARQARADQIERFLISELGIGRRYTNRDLEGSLDRLDGMKRDHLRAAITDLRVTGRVVDMDLPAKERKGARRSYLHPANCAEPSGAIGEEG